MARHCKKLAPVCTDEPLNNDRTCQAMAALKQILSSCYGPRGMLKHIRNDVGGTGVTTSTSAVLVREITFSEPLLKLIATAIAKQTTRFSDAGLFTGLLCISLVENAKRSGLGAAVASRVYNYLLEECAGYLRADHCGCRTPVDFGSAESVVTLARSMITSKQACVLGPDDVRHVVSLTVLAFLQSVPCASSTRTCFGRTMTVTLEGQAVSKSAVFPGLLVDVPILQSMDLKNLSRRPCKIALFGASLSGDLSEFGEQALEIDAGVNPEPAVLNHLLKLGERVVRDGVAVFACQKVIHPVLQHYLKQRGLVVIERLGLALVEPLAQMTGALIIASLGSPFPTESYGQLLALHRHRIGSKEFLQLLPCEEPAINTLLLCHRNETMLDELKTTCQRTEHVLRLTVKEPYALLGGGCTETVLSAYISYMSESKASEAASALTCSRSEFLLGAEAFCSSLRSPALSLGHGGQHLLMDVTHAHCWLADLDAQPQTSCRCGLATETPYVDKIALSTHLKTTCLSSFPAPVGETKDGARLLDSFTAKLNALTVAVETANLVLDVKYVITDMN